MSAEHQPGPKKRSCLQAIAHLRLAQKALEESLVQERIFRLYRGLLRPTSFFLVCIAWSSVSLFWWAVGLSFSLAAFLSGLCVIFPLLWYMWRGDGEHSYTHVLADVARADECILELEESSLLHWESFHPDLSKEELVSADQLHETLDRRIIQIEQWMMTELVEDAPKDAETTQAIEDAEEALDERTFRDDFWLPPRLLAHKNAPSYRRDAFERYEKPVEDEE